MTTLILTIIGLLLAAAARLGGALRALVRRARKQVTAWMHVAVVPRCGTTVAIRVRAMGWRTTGAVSRTLRRTAVRPVPARLPG